MFKKQGSLARNLYLRFERIFALDLRSLAVFRIALAGIILCDLFNRAHDITAHYSDRGVLPRYAITYDFPKFYYICLHYISGQSWVEAVLFLVAALIAVCLLLGYRTRLACILSWFFLVSLQARNPMVLQGGDIELKLLLFWSIFLPLGANFSIDSALDTRPEQKRELQISSMASLALIVQIICVYFFSALMKSGAEWRTQGTAIYYALNIDQLTTTFGHYLLQFPNLLHFLTPCVFYWELLGAFLLLIPFYNTFFRLIAIGGFVLFHLSLVSIMYLGLFPFISICAFLPLLPSSFWNLFLRKPDQKRADIYFDGDCGFCKKISLIIRSFLGLRSIPLLPAQNDENIEAQMKAHNSWIVLDQQKQLHFEYGAFLQLLSLSPLWKWTLPLFRSSLLKSCGTHCYRCVASHRMELEKLSQFIKYRPYRIHLDLIGNAFATFFIFLVLWWNLATWNNNFRIPNIIKTTTEYFRLGQDWAMFAPYPLKNDGWYIITGTLANKSKIGLFPDMNHGEAVRWDKPQQVSRMYRNQRWRKYMMNLRKKKNKRYRFYFANYLCQNWNRHHSYNDDLASVEIFFMEEQTQSQGLAPKLSKKVLWNQWCHLSRENFASRK